jgi:hypothetical protein
MIRMSHVSNSSGPVNLDGSPAPSRIAQSAGASLTAYTADDFEALRRMAQGVSVPGLCHRSFVDYYYTDNPWCSLCLLRNADGVAGTIGVERMPFAVGERSLTLGFASNFHAPQHGLGGYLFLHLMKTTPLGIVFGGSSHTHRILQQQRWTYFSGIRTYVLNPLPFFAPDEPAWRKWAKRGLCRWRRLRLDAAIQRVPRAARQLVSVQEEQTFTEDMLPRTSPFTLRLAPSLDYLRWRYRPGLPFVRYRLFRVGYGGRTVGYVVLNESPHRILVAHCDGEDACRLAVGVLLSVAEITKADVEYREIRLACSHAEMQPLFTAAGFRPEKPDRPFAIGARRGKVDVPADTSRWLVNFDWGDNGLRSPFLDEAP